MTEAPGGFPGPLSVSSRGSWLGLGIAAAGLVVSAALVSVYRGSVFLLHGWPEWATRVADLVVLSAPFIGALVLARTFGAGAGGSIRRGSWIDVIVGVSVGLAARALVEIVQPTTGTLAGPLGEVGAGTVVLVVGFVLVTPVVEELFFRGLLLRSFMSALGPLGRVWAVALGVAVSTAAFVALHLLPYGFVAPVGVVMAPVVVGIGCGMLVAATGRLGAAIVAHVVFNAVGVALLVVQG